MATLVLTTQSEAFEGSRASQRSSMVSTTASFQTAPLAPGSTSSRSRSSSVDTVPAPKFNGTALGSSSSTQDVTTGWTVRDVERWDEVAEIAPPTGASLNRPPSHSTIATTLRQPPSRSHTTDGHVLAPLSTEPASSILSTRPPRPIKLSQSSADTQVHEIILSTASSPAKQSPDPAALLHPSSAAAVSVRPARRNTTGSALPLVGGSKPGRSNKSSLTGSTAPQVYDPDLDADIQRQAEQVRRERKQRELEEAEQAQAHATGKKGHHSRTGSAGAKSLEEWKPIVGHIVGEGHVNYILMYNMLTGIRVSVSRCQAKLKRPLTDEDYTARHKYNFDVIGNELTPSAKYDFKFKDYAPWVFRELREENFHIDPADYLLSLTSKYILSELGSPGKSGSFFYFSRDYRFIIKTIHHTEHKFLRGVLRQYHQHIMDNPHTLISRFYGLHRVKLPRGRKIHFLIMNNLFPPHKDVHEMYDLKGSTVGRLYSEEKAADNPGAVLKDVNWIERGRTIELGPYKRALLVEQLRRDAEFLKSIGVMDYSLLIGLHNLSRGNKDNLRSTTLKVFEPGIAPSLSPGARKWAGVKAAMEVRRQMRQSQSVGAKKIDLPEEDPNASDRTAFIFYTDEGGYRATNEVDGEMQVVYYLGVIDILTPYNLWKKAEHIWKGLRDDKHKISPVPPYEYGDRFFSFLQDVMRGGAGGKKYLP